MAHTAHSARALAVALPEVLLVLGGCLAPLVLCTEHSTREEPDHPFIALR